MNILSKRAEELLLEILNHRHKSGLCDTNYWRDRFGALSYSDDIILRSVFKELIACEMIHVQWGNNYPYLMNVLANGLTYFEEKDKMENNKATVKYENNFYAPTNNVQIQQGTTNSTQNLADSKSLDIEKIKELVTCVNRYDSILNEEYGAENASELRKAISELEECIKQSRETDKVPKILSYIRDLSIGVSGGVISSWIIKLIETVMG